MGNQIRQIIGICFIIFSAAALPCRAQNANTHTVTKGETLFSIAKKQGVSVQQIKKRNHLSGNKLSIGQILIIKKGDGASKSASGRSHTVKPNETLFSIAHKYNVSVNQIKEWNNLQGSHLTVGQTLTIHTSAEQADSPPSNHSKSSPLGQRTYTVKSGDSLFRIARTHNMSIARIKQMNNLSSNTIHVGQKLALKPTDRIPSLTSHGVKSSSQGKFIRYTVKKTQSRAHLLKEFGMDSTEFEALNEGVKQTSFHRGDEITLLAPANKSYKNPYVVRQSMSSLGNMEAVKYQKKPATPTTSGELYNPNALTAADGNMALGSVIYLQNPQNNRGVLVRINDRATGSDLKLSQAVWKALNIKGSRASLKLYRTANE